MTKEFARYRQLERRLWLARWTHEGRESPDEDTMLDEMEAAWFRLTDEEQDRLRGEPPRCWPGESSSLPPDLAATPHLGTPGPWGYEGFHSPNDAILDEDAA